MILLLAYTHRDILSAHRLIKWIGFLSSKRGRGMKKERLLLTCNRMAHGLSRTREIVDTAVKIFGKVSLHGVSSDDEDDKPWPVGPNRMFRDSMLHAEAWFPGDIFWIEPDAVPVTPDWFDRILAEHKRGGRIFTGGRVPLPELHMTGVGVYGKDWRSVAPKLWLAQDVPFDTFAGHQVSPHCNFTPLIQHIFLNPVIIGTEILKKETVVFHQDKEGRLIKNLDSERFGGELYKGADDIVIVNRMETKYYHADNSNRIIKSGGIKFTFEPYACMAGTWRGLYTTDNESEGAALDAVSTDPASGITRIDQAEYNSKKKVTTPSSHAWQESEQPKVQLKPSPAVLVENPLPSPEIRPESPTVSDAIQIDTVAPSEPPPPPEQKRKGKRSNG